MALCADCPLEGFVEILKSRAEDAGTKEEAEILLALSAIVLAESLETSRTCPDGVPKIIKLEDTAANEVVYELFCSDAAKGGLATYISSVTSMGNSSMSPDELESMYPNLDPRRAVTD